MVSSRTKHVNTVGSVQGSFGSRRDRYSLRSLACLARFAYTHTRFLRLVISHVTRPSKPVQNTSVLCTY
jgi:hypothetical protein